MRGVKGEHPKGSTPHRPLPNTLSTYRASAGAGGSDSSSRSGLSLISGGTSGSGKSNGSGHTRSSILTGGTVGSLATLVTLG